MTPAFTPSPGFAVAGTSNASIFGSTESWRPGLLAKLTPLSTTTSYKPSESLPTVGKL